MDILGIGPLELLFILLIALIVLGPKDMVKAGRTIGSFLRKIVKSPTWHTVQQASQEIRVLPNRLIREAGLDELEGEMEEIKNITKDPYLEKLDEDLKTWKEDISSWTTPPSPNSAPQKSDTPEKLKETSSEPSIESDPV